MLEEFNVRVLRQTEPETKPYWEMFEVPYKSGLNVTSVLQQIAANPITKDGQKTTPVAYESSCLEEMCGACSMMVNRIPQQACSSLITGNVILAPLANFSVIRDLIVDRSQIFESLKKVRAWVDTSHEKQDDISQEKHYLLSQCMTCGCCMAVCESCGGQGCLGAAVISQAILFNKLSGNEGDRVDREKVLSDQARQCQLRGHCTDICPKKIPLHEFLEEAQEIAAKRKPGKKPRRKRR